MNSLKRLIDRLTYPKGISNEDAFDTVKQYWDDVTSGYWQDTDEDLAEELGVTPTALAELLEVHRHTFNYANIGGNSSVRGYDHGEDWLVVMFSDGSRYLYTLKSTDQQTLDYMRRLAMAGKGLNSYITRIVGPNYAGRNYKGTITIKPGMEQYNPEGYRRLLLLQAFRNTMEHNTVSNEGFFDSVKKFMGMSNKDIERDITRNYTYNHNGFANAIQKHFGDKDWLNKQTFITGPIDAKGISDFVGVNGKADIHKAISANNEFEKVREAWKKCMNDYFDKIKPILSKYKDGPYNDDTYDALKAYFDKVPFPTLPKGLVTESGRYTDKATGSIEALTEDDVFKAATAIVASLRNIWEKFDNNLEEAKKRDSVHLSKTWIHLAHSPTPDIKGFTTKHSAKEWEAIALRMDGLAVYWSDPNWSKALTGYRETFYACAKWIDRSIKGKQVVSSEGHVVTTKTLIRYKDQITQSGQDGLDPVARQLMWVGLESMGTGNKVALESATDNSTTNPTKALEAVVDSVLLGKSELGLEGILDGLRKMFSANKDKDIYSTVNKGFLWDLRKEIEKYTNVQWVEDKGIVSDKTVEIEGANLLSQYDKVVGDFVKQCMQVRQEHDRVAEQAFNNVDEAIKIIEGKKLSNTNDVERLRTIIKTTRQLKIPRPDVPKVKAVVGKAKTLNAQQIADKAKRLVQLFDTLNADTKYVKRWNDSFINSHAWMDWKYVGQKNYKEFYDQVKDPKLTEQYMRMMEHVYEMSHMGVEFYHLKPFIMAEFQLIEKSVAG